MKASESLPKLIDQLQATAEELRRIDGDIATLMQGLAKSRRVDEIVRMWVKLGISEEEAVRMVRESYREYEALYSKKPMDQRNGIDF